MVYGPDGHTRDFRFSQWCCWRYSSFIGVWRRVFDSRRFDKSNPFILESRAVLKSVVLAKRNGVAPRNTWPAKYTGVRARNLASFCAMDLRRAAGLGRFLRSDSRVRRTGWCRKEEYSLLQLWNVAGSFTKNKPRPLQEYHAVSSGWLSEESE